MNKHVDELLVELECPLCLTYMSPPIQQCASGHSICESCRKKLPACPLCQGRFMDTKDYLLEALAKKMHYLCVNHKSGCPERVTLDLREAHEEICAFKSYKCFFSNCTWLGKYEDLLEHWAQKKTTSRLYRESNVCHTKILKRESFYVNMIQAFDELFWYKFKSSGGKLFWTVQYIGAAKRASEFYFEIELFKPGQPIRRTLLSEYCQPVDIDSKDLFKAETSVITTTEAINHFFGDDQLLIFYLKVKEIWDKHRRNGSEPAPRDISPNNNNNNSDSSGEKTGGGNGHHMHGKTASVKQPRSWYKPPHRTRYTKSSSQPQPSTPQHKRKRPVKYTQIKD